MNERPSSRLTDRQIRDALAGDGDVPADVVRSISDHAHSTPQQSGQGVLGWLGPRPMLAGSRALAAAVLLLIALLLIGGVIVAGARQARLSVAPPPSAAPFVTSGPATAALLPAGWSHVADVPRLDGDGVGPAVDGVLVLANAGMGDLGFLDPTAGDGGQVVARLDVGARSRGLPMAPDARGWWIGIGGEHELIRFDPATRSIVRRLPIEAEAYNVASAGPIVYVTDFERGRLVRVDTSTGIVTAARDLVQAAGIAVLPDGSVMVASRPGALLEVDPVTLATLDEAAVQGDLMNLIPDGGRLIITRNNADRLSTIDPDNLSAGEELTETRISAFTVTDTAAWGIDWQTGDILRLDRGTLAVTERVPALSAGQDGISVAAGDLWIEGMSVGGPVIHRVRPGEVAAP
jgi:streptogramin lyase